MALRKHDQVLQAENGKVLSRRVWDKRVQMDTFLKSCDGKKRSGVLDYEAKRLTN